MAGWEGSAGARAFRFRRNTDARFLEDGQNLRMRFLQLDHTHRLDLLRTGTPHRVLKWVDGGIGKAERKRCAKDKCAPTKTAEDEKSDSGHDKEWRPDIGITNDRHEQIENRIRPLLVNQMKDLLVHSIVPARSENKSARRMKQVTVIAACVLSFGSAWAENFPNADQLLANVRLSQSQQQIDLRGQLRQEATIVPFHLVQNGPLIRYIFTNPDETLQLRIGTKDSRLVEINRTGSEKITRLSEPVRGTVITYEDLALKFLYWPNARVTGSDFIRTRNCWKVELPAPAADPQYGSILLWVDKDSGALMRMEGYDGTGKLIKRFEVVSAQKIEDRWYLKQMRVEKVDPKSAKVSARTYLEINK